MALRSLILLVTLTVSVTSGFDFDCTNMPGKEKGELAGTTITAVPEKGQVKVTAVGTEKVKVLRITAMDDAGKEIVKGEFTIPDKFKELVMHLACGDAKMAAVVNKDETKEQGTNVELTWKPAAGVKGKLKFVLVGGLEGDKYFMTESAVIDAPTTSNGGAPDKQPTKAPTKAAASSTGLSAWLVIVASGLFVALGLGRNMSAN